MEELSEILRKINIPTSCLTLDSIQEILIKVKKNKVDKQYIEIWNQIGDILWKHLETGLSRFDDQLLCATCFYNILACTDNADFYLKEMLQLIESELHKENTTKNNNSCRVVSLMYGMFQSVFLLIIAKRSMILEAVLKSTFKLLCHNMAYEYAPYTFIAFKTIKTFGKVCGTKLEGIIFNVENQNRLLNMVNHNWENPISGVRDLNREIFQTLLSVMAIDMYNTTLLEINTFYWNKAKYLMISEILAHCNDVFLILQKSDWVEGLLYSLHKPGIVSAGADMYFAILKKLKSEKDWCRLFLPGVMKILNGPSTKAIENFSNYWCLTTLKQFPTLNNELLEELEALESEQKLLSSLCVMQQGNKLGIIDKNFTKPGFIEMMVLNGIEHNNTHIRMLAFNIVCVIQAKSMPSEFQFKLILDFLNNNINSDSTILRLSMLTSLKMFLLQLHTLFLNNLKSNQNVTLDNLLSFCRRLQEFIIKSLSFNGNYQRKITCVTLTTALFDCLSMIPKKKRDQTRVKNTTLLEFLRNKKNWTLSEETVVQKFISLLKDPADDVRESVVQLLLKHYPTEMQREDTMNNLINNALISLNSKFFYEISCGHSMFKLIVNIMLRNTCYKSKFTNMEDVLSFGFNGLVTEFKLKRHVMDSVEAGTQLHSFISIIVVTLEVCILNKCKIEYLNKHILELLETLEGISNQFQGEQSNSTSNDFSKMSEMVEHLIVESGYKSTDENDQTKISGLHQIVLNCLWLNAKATCDLAALLIQYFEEDVDICNRCLTLITHVLETSRHKGAIEAAGSALGRGIQHLTYLPEKSINSMLPHNLLKNKLDELISETSEMASVTRRGAGLSIMVHRIVASDMKKGKPLFHYFMKIILETCKKSEDLSIKQSTNPNMDNEIDLPKAIHIHFLTRIVTDSSLASELMFYSAELAQLAFFNLTSSHWQIRNAALQLYGSLIPRQIGQRKAAGSDEETIATVACDELRTHSPELWKYIAIQLRNANSADLVLSHSNLVPTLNLLASNAMRYNFSQNLAEQKENDAELLSSLLLLLGSPIYTVRRLTAKCIFNMYSFESIYNILMKLECRSENYLHGHLILLSISYKYYCKKTQYADCLTKLIEKYRLILTDPHSYLCKELFEDIFEEDFPEDFIHETLSQVNKNTHVLGIHKWAGNRIWKYIFKCLWEQTPQILQILLQNNDYEMNCESLLLKIEEDNCIPENVLFEIVAIILMFEGKFTSCIIWKILYQISMLVNLDLDVSAILENYKAKGIPYKQRYIIPFSARLCTNSTDDISFMISDIIYTLSNYETDLDMRYTAVLANNELSNVFEKLSQSAKVVSIKAAVMFLQDEDEDVRTTSTIFYKNIIKRNIAVQPYICLHKILNYDFLDTNVGVEGIKDICMDLSGKLLRSTNEYVDEYNPFANDSKNIYLERNVLRELIDNLNNK